MEADGKNKFPLKVTSLNESAHVHRKLHEFQRDAGLPVEECVKVVFQRPFMS
jgi:hypothetical protein